MAPGWDDQQPSAQPQGFAPPSYAPPAPGPPPPPERGRRKIILIAAAAMAVVVIAVVLVLVLRGGGNGERFVGTWAAQAAGAGEYTIAISETGDGAFSLTMIDPTSSQTAPAATAKLNGGKLVSEQSASGVSVKLVCSLSDDNHMTVKFEGATGSLGGNAQVTFSLPFTRVESPSPTGESGSAAGLRAKDEAAKAALRAIEVGVKSYAAEHDGQYPLAAEVSASGAVGQYVQPWPTNQFSGQPMAQGTARGDFSYEVTAAGYKLTLHTADSGTYVIP